MTEQSEVEYLRDLHRTISERLCELTSHEWRTIVVESDDYPLNVSGIEECTRCKRRRLKPSLDSGNTSDSTSYEKYPTGGSFTWDDQGETGGSES